MQARPPGEPQRKRVEGQVRRFLLDRGLLPEDRRVLVAVSGGPDSTALLLILSRLAKNLGLRLGVAHFDHGLRGPAAATRESRFVQDLTASLCLPFFGGAGDVRAEARSRHLSIEDAARRLRYAFLAAVAEREGYTAVATGHTASDQAETVLLHLLRGAGLDGLAGMAPRSRWPFPGASQLTLLRPLFGVTRAQTVAYCAAAEVTPVEDESNVSREYRRNRVRHELVPLLREFNPRIEAALVRLADAAAEDTGYLQSQAESLVLPSDGPVQRLSRGSLAGAPSPLRVRALRFGLARAAGDAQELNQRHLDALERLVLTGRPGDRLDLPRGVEAVLRRDVLELRPIEPPRPLPAEPVILTVPGETRFGPLIVAVGVEPPPGATTRVEVDAAAVGSSTCVRRRRPGDRLQPLGMTGQKKLQDLLTDAGVPRDQRDTVPIFESPRGIAWVGGLRIADWAKPRSGQPTVYLSYRPI